jgi:conjugative transposon TraM protein
MKTQSEAFLRRRRFLLVLPLLVLPFLTMAFWALGGGAGTAAMTPQAVRGLNLQLPEPQLQKEESGKLNLYQQARHKLQKQQDTGGKNFLLRLGLGSLAEKDTGAALGDFASALPATPPGPPAQGFLLKHEDPTEEKINERISWLSQLVGQEPVRPEPEPKQKAKKGSIPLGANDESRFSQDVAKLETMMRTMGGGKDGAAADLEMQQMEGMLERILDIQHPERVKERLREEPVEDRQQVLAVQAASEGPTITLLHQASSPHSSESVPSRTSFPNVTPQQGLAQNIFYSLHLDNAPSIPEQQGNIIEAAVHETQTLTAGAVVKLRLLQDAYLGDRILPVGSLLYGTCHVKGERLSIEVTSIHSGNALLPVSLSAYELDGMEGLYIPNSPVREAAQQSAGRSISQSLQLPILSPSLGAQAASAGIDAARGLLSKGARQVKVTVKAGHRLLLRDQQAQL